MHGPSYIDPPGLPSSIGSSRSLFAETSIPREVPAWLASMFLNMLLIVALGSIWMPRAPIRTRPVLEASIAQPPDPEEEPQKKFEIEKQDFDLRPSELPNV